MELQYFQHNHRMHIKNKIKLIEETANFLYRYLKKCRLCPRNCGVNRLGGQKGYCGGGKDLLVYTAFLHWGEEPAITGKGGSGTIFFSGCNLKCIYCQNYKFSHLNKGKVITEEELAKIMLKLQEKGASNINLVTPAHFLPQILRSLSAAWQGGLKLPIVYNTSGYEKEEIIEYLEGIIDIYLVDMRYITPSLSKKYSQAADYPLQNQRTLQAISAQKKKNCWDGGRLKSGIIIRHLVLPGYIRETFAVLSWIKNNIPQALVSVMAQYQPYFKAYLFPEINRPITSSEYQQVKNFTEDLKLNGWLQEFDPPEEFAGINFSPSLEI